MTPAEYRVAIKTLGLTQRRAGALFGYSEQHGQRIAGPGPVPVLVAIMVELLETGRLTITELEALSRKHATITVRE